jgi:HSP20 family molecular chaperone IbpA
MIRERAYDIFLGRDRHIDDSLGDWLRAKSDVLTTINMVLKDGSRNIVVEADLKGFNPEDIEIELYDGTLRVSGSHEEASASETEHGSESRSQTTNFYQSMQLPTAVDADKAQATLSASGKLKLTLPKVAATASKPKPAKAGKPAAKRKASRSKSTTAKAKAPTTKSKVESAKPAKSPGKTDVPKSTG